MFGGKTCHVFTLAEHVYSSHVQTQIQPMVTSSGYIENNIWSRGDMEFIFECSHRYRMSERSEQVRYRM